MRDEAPARPDVDENGVDRAQIRAMLALTPAERLRRLQQIVSDILEIRRLNADRGPIASSPDELWSSSQ